MDRKFIIIIFNFLLIRSSSDISLPCISAIRLVREVVCTCYGHVCVREAHGSVKDYYLVLLRASWYDPGDQAGSVIRTNLQPGRQGWNTRNKTTVVPHKVALLPTIVALLTHVTLPIKILLKWKCIRENLCHFYCYVGCTNRDLGNRTFLPSYTNTSKFLKRNSGGISGTGLIWRGPQWLVTSPFKWESVTILYNVRLV